MAGNHELVRDIIMSFNIATLIVEHLQIRDDDLLFYTLALISNLSKVQAHREALCRCQVVDQLLLLLLMVPAMPSKHKALSELASCLGQFCNDMDIWVRICNDKYNVAERLIELLMAASLGGRLRARVLYALRQFCFRANAEAAQYRELIGRVMPAVIEELRGVVEGEELQSKRTDDAMDCAANAILLLSSLSLSNTLVDEMLDLGVKDLFARMRVSRLGSMDLTRERLDGLGQRIRDREAGLSQT
eukprot:TRINITY_DN16098_c0_g1_i2.p1 TRINITY_DN16098_c0_g1~~TRINITY_DN16098_c0_g1_i2.p1  ORF type:complete len:246 (+),score=40.79 TRINITY_DN16098_c0_g1_i2:1-738(+)